MTDFTKDEMICMMLYNPGTREGLMAELEAMRSQLDRKSTRLNSSHIH